MFGDSGDSLETMKDHHMTVEERNSLKTAKDGKKQLIDSKRQLKASKR